ncbi:MAG: hypothetical protein RL329_1902 [Bacteroidota bacterium]|jgi:hypothetical protein
MIQLFFKASEINAPDWEIAFSRIIKVTQIFPLPLLRVEAYDGYSRTLDKNHLELRENIGMPNESISFYGDAASFTAGFTIRFYKNWNQYEKWLIDKTQNANKSITWYPDAPFRNDGMPPNANGLTTKSLFIDTHDGLYEYAIIAIGILLENQFPNKAFMIAKKQHISNIQLVINWLSFRFRENFELPVYFDPKRLFDSFAKDYTTPYQLVNRMAHLYRNKHRQNIAFAIKHIGYRATFEYYAELLSKNTFGTFGFADILEPWIAETQDLEETLKFVAASKKHLIQRNEQSGADKYDLIYLLKTFLKKFILWNHAQRESLALFYTNQQALESGNESLMGMIYRMTGNRVDICPMYATEQSLFEAFMYHEPKSGHLFKQIIDESMLKKVTHFEELKQSIADAEIEMEATPNEEQNFEYEAFLANYDETERPFIQLALAENPVYATIDEHITELKQVLRDFKTDKAHEQHVQQIQRNSNKKNKAFILSRLKEDIKMSVHPQFESWLAAESDKKVLFYLTALLSFKLYDSKSAYVRYCLLWDKKIWDEWRK